MKKYISILLALIALMSLFTGCDKEKLKLPDMSKYDVTTTTAKQKEDSVNDLIQTDTNNINKSNSTKNKTKVNNSKLTTNKNTNAVNQGTTSKQGSPTLTKQKMDVLYYTEAGEEKTVSVTIISGFEYEMLEYVNKVRKDANKPPLQLNKELIAAARYRAAEAYVRWSHTRPDGTQWHTIYNLLPAIHDRFKAGGENLAKGQTSVDNVMKSWMNSKGHRENILSTSNDYNYIGVAWIIAPNGVNMWAQEFAYLS